MLEDILRTASPANIRIDRRLLVGLGAAQIDRRAKISEA
jgi:hypothetical protein